MIERIKSYSKTPLFKMLSVVCIIWFAMVFSLAKSENDAIKDCAMKVEMVDGTVYSCYKTLSIKNGITYIYQCDDTKIQVSTARINIIN